MLMLVYTGTPEARAHDLHFALWIPDLFMNRVLANGTWSLFCPNEAPGLADVWGDEFEALYVKVKPTCPLCRLPLPMWLMCMCTYSMRRLDLLARR